jgi:hypothetical protein
VRFCEFVTDDVTDGKWKTTVKVWATVSRVNSMLDSSLTHHYFVTSF